MVPSSGFPYLYNTSMLIKWPLTLQAYISRKHDGDKVIVFERAGLVFVFSFHPTQSFTDYKIGVQVPGKNPF